LIDRARFGLKKIYQFDRFFESRLSYTEEKIRALRKRAKKSEFLLQTGAPPATHAFASISIERPSPRRERTMTKLISSARWWIASASRNFLTSRLAGAEFRIASLARTAMNP